MYTVEPVSQITRDPAPPLPSGKLVADPVPEAVRPQPVPLARIAMPIVMVLAVLGMVALMVLGSGGRTLNPMTLLFPVMMLMSVAMMFSPQASSQDPDETRRTYLRHLRALREKARDHGAAQRAHELHQHPDPSHLGVIINSRRLWERAPGDSDVLEARIGLGPVSLCTPIEVPETSAPEDLDPVCAVSLRHAIHDVGQLSSMPVIIQLQAFKFLAMGGQSSRAMARAMILQLACAHGPEVLGISALGPGWEWLKWLPHTKDPRSAQHHILVVDSLTTTGLEDFFEDEQLTTIIGVGTLRTTALGMRAEQEGLYLIVDQDVRVVTQAGDEVLGVPDSLTEAQALTLARRLAPCRRPAGSVARRSHSGNLIELLGYNDIDQLGKDMWSTARTGGARLNVPIGIDSEGLPVQLDLKESAQGGAGPHGLCIGATGSGKSELLRTLVTSLAATHSPQELNLVLVDFKGGATFLGCDDLPHTSAVITNLEEESILVERMYDAISGELNRRQEVLRRAGNFANVTDYNAASGEDFPPMPALVIVVDEFSELLGQHPDFAELFVAVGRLGRSLHVHLLLASQRLEEGRLRGLDSHLSYRLGLKTFSAAESRQVLGITDAYSLPSKPGAGYLKTGADDPVRVQASYVSGPLTRRVLPASATAYTVTLFHGWEPERVIEATEEVDASTTLVDSVVRLAKDKAASLGQQAHQIWLPPLPARIELSELMAKTGDSAPGALAAPVAVVDRPFQQRQDPLFIDLATAGGHVALCGGPQSGKSTAALSLAASLALRHQPGAGEGQLCFYAIDLGGGSLTHLERLPHTAGVAGKNQPDKVRRIVDEIWQRAESSAGHIVLIVDGWHNIGVAGADFEDLAERITQLAADGPALGIHVVITTPRWTTMRPSIRDLMAHRLELKLAEPMDSLIDRKAQEKIPALPGRGLSGEGEQILFASTSAQDLAHIAAQWAEVPAVAPLRVLPTHLPAHQVDTQAHEQRIALGIGGPRLETMWWNDAEHPHFVCVGSAESGKSTVLTWIAGQLAQRERDQVRLVVLDPRRAHLAQLPEEMVAAYAPSTSAAEEAVRATVTTLKSRLPGNDVTPEQLARRDWWEGPEIYVVIDDLDLIPELALYPLIELLPHAKDIGLHLVIARKSGGISRAMFSGFLAALKDQQPAVMLLDADREEGPIFGIKPSVQPAGRGRWIVRGQDQGLVQCVAPNNNNLRGNNE